MAPPQPEGIPGYITASEAARLANIKVSTLRMRRFREGGHPEVVQLGAVVLYNEQAFQAYLDSWVDGRRTA
jgi:hypothetical protein